MVQRIEQTYEEKVEMFQKCSKEELIEMLIESNRLLDTFTGNDSNGKLKYNVVDEQQLQNS